MPRDLLIAGGTVLDGTGAAPVLADVLIRDGSIAEVGGERPDGAETLDAAGMLVAPGFIDIHSHSDYTLLVDPRARSAIHQGVTLEVVGNCGHGCFPIGDPALARGAMYGHNDAVTLDWSTAAGYFERLDVARPAVNVLSLVPNGQLRLAEVGLADRAATPDEAGAMARALEEALEQGAWGYSTGLEYAAEAGAPAEEIAGLCAVAARRGALYATHTRRRDGGAAEAVEEALDTAARAGGRLQVSHLIPRSGEAEGRRCMEAVARAREDGLDVAFDMHTRLFGFTYLATVLPAWATGPGLAVTLRDPDARARMKRHRSILSEGGDWTRVVLLDNPVVPQHADRDLASLAAERGQEPLDTAYDLLLEAVDAPHELMVMIRCHSERQQREAFADPLCMPGSDATTLAPDGPLAGSVFHGAYGWAAWFYRFMVRDTRLLAPAEAVRRLTSMPAGRLGLSDRGKLRPGARADVAIFDGDRFGEQATTAEPNRLATGMRHVVVNGVVTLRDGEPTGDRAGEVLRR